MDQVKKQGVIFALLAYGMWGLAPLYFKQIADIPSMEILVHRIIWSTLLLGIIIGVQKQWASIRNVLRSPKTARLMLLSASLIGFNWWLFIWSINNDHILDASLGYYINPLLNVALGMLFLGERLSKLQYAAVGLAVTGVAIQLITFGSFPIIAFGLALSFAFYGLIRKTVAVDSVAGLLIESLLLVTPAALYWWFAADSYAVNMLENSLGLNLWLMTAGLVTTLPLLCFVAGTRRLNYSTMGFFQYIGPSIMFMFAVFMYKEPMGQDRWVTFGFIWSALVVYSAATLQSLRKKSHSIEHAE